MPHYYLQLYLNTVFFLENDYLFLISISSLLALIGYLIFKINEKKKYSRMISDYLLIKFAKRTQLIGLMTAENGIVVSDIKNSLCIDITKFDSEYRDILYQDFLKIKKEYDVNPRNWDLFIKLLYLNSKNKI
ncbi:hypothetical protein SAMN04487893_101138 [Myroides guanonis]|uniref:Uncharacterized protein n=2 Tax=Myroides guanonis TaxID=1150112 RepID=A0A1I3L142_9FLAO|nr:hypothetical protein SAMN04487893_101138 [Myroides guanonis]